MNLVILHHHLNRGGVAQVIINHLRSLASLPAAQQPERVLILHDGQRDGWPTDLPQRNARFRLDLVVVPEIAYDAIDAPIDVDRLSSAIDAALASERVTAADSVLHVHNHSLGKNASLPGALAQFASRGWRLLLQIHDFAEDNRPASYRRLADALREHDPEGLGGLLYPQAPHIHYATLTRRDAAVLAAAGVPNERLRPLPNPAAEFGEMLPFNEARRQVCGKLSLPSGARLLVYPVRGIRRKNVGELLLLAALAPEDAYLAITLAPKNPVEYPSFAAWSELARGLSLRCRFDTGGEYDVEFHDALAAADAILTTSVAEGFGMVFLEAWLANRALVGRDLPEITDEFRDGGLSLDHLYDRLPVPLSLLDAAGVREDLSAIYFDTCGRYGLTSMPKEIVRRCIDELLVDDCVDFGRLAPVRQADLIEHVAKHADARDLLLQINQTVARSLAIRQGDMQQTVAANATAVRERYSTAAAGRRLYDVYQRVLSSSIDEQIEPVVNGRAVLDYFVTPERILPVRVAQWTT